MTGFFNLAREILAKKKKMGTRLTPKSRIILGGKRTRRLYLRKLGEEPGIGGSGMTVIPALRVKAVVH